MLISFARTLDNDLQQLVRQAPHFRRWLDRSSAAFDLRGVHVRDVAMFGSRVGFIFLEADAWHDGKPVPKYVFLRGDSVSVLVVLRCAGEPDRTLLTCEPRLPVGCANLLSLPAGMLDGGAFSSSALRELSEEIGADLPVRADQLVELTETWTSPGGCDEAIRLYYAEIDVEPELIAALQDRVTGNADEHESIVVRVVALDSLPKLGMTDAKTLLSHALYVMRKGREPRDIAVRA